MISTRPKVRLSLEVTTAKTAAAKVQKKVAVLEAKVAKEKLLRQEAKPPQARTKQVLVGII
jgi:hypothetical protein